MNGVVRLGRELAQFAQQTHLDEAACALGSVGIFGWVSKGLSLPFRAQAAIAIPSASLLLVALATTLVEKDDRQEISLSTSQLYAQLVDGTTSLATGCRRWSLDTVTLLAGLSGLGIWGFKRDLIPSNYRLPVALAAGSALIGGLGIRALGEKEARSSTSKDPLWLKLISGGISTFQSGCRSLSLGRIAVVSGLALVGLWQFKRDTIPPAYRSWVLNSGVALVLGGLTLRLLSRGDEGETRWLSLPSLPEDLGKGVTTFIRGVKRWKVDKLIGLATLSAVAVWGLRRWEVVPYERALVVGPALATFWGGVALFLFGSRESEFDDEGGGIGELFQGCRRWNLDKVVGIASFAGLVVWGARQSGVDATRQAWIAGSTIALGLGSLALLHSGFGNRPLKGLADLIPSPRLVCGAAVGGLTGLAIWGVRYWDVASQHRALVNGALAALGIGSLGLLFFAPNAKSVQSLGDSLEGKGASLAGLALVGVGGCTIWAARRWGLLQSHRSLVIGALAATGVSVIGLGLWAVGSEMIAKRVEPMVEGAMRFGATVGPGLILVGLAGSAVWAYRWKTDLPNPRLLLSSSLAALGLGSVALFLFADDGKGLEFLIESLEKGVGSARGRLGIMSALFGGATLAIWHFKGRTLPPRWQLSIVIPSGLLVATSLVRVLTRPAPPPSSRQQQQQSSPPADTGGASSPAANPPKAEVDESKSWSRWYFDNRVSDAFKFSEVALPAEKPADVTDGVWTMAGKIVKGINEQLGSRGKEGANNGGRECYPWKDEPLEAVRCIEISRGNLAAVGIEIGVGLRFFSEDASLINAMGVLKDRKIILEWKFQQGVPATSRSTDGPSVDVLRIQVGKTPPEDS